MADNNRWAGRGAALKASVVGGLLVAVYGPTFAWLWGRWSMGIWYQSHGLVIPAVAVGLIVYVLRSLPANTPAVAGSWFGIPLLVAALGIHAADTVLWSQIASAGSLVIAAWGLSLAFLGWPRTRMLWFPLALLPFMIPLPSVIIQPVLLVLRRLSAFGTEHLMSACGVPVVRLGTELIFLNASISIVDACSGFSTLSATLAYACILLYLKPIGLPRGALFVALAFPVALFANVLRCSMLAFLAIGWGTEMLDTFLHPLSGYLAYAVGLGLQTLGMRLLGGRP